MKNIIRHAAVAAVLSLFGIQVANAASSLFTSASANSNWTDAAASGGWSLTTGGTYNVDWANGSNAVFEGTAGTITLTSPTVTANSLTLNTSGYTIAGVTADPLTLTGAASVAVTTGSATISALISGSNGLLVNGTGTLTLSGSNNYTGTTTLSTGNLVLNSNTTADASGYVLGDANTGSNNLSLNLGAGFNATTGTVVGVGARLINVTVAGQGTGTATIDVSKAGTNPDLVLSINRATTIKGPKNQLLSSISGAGAGAGNDSLILDVNGGNFVWTSNGTANTFTGNVHFINSSSAAGTLQMQNNSYVSNIAADQNLMIPDTSSVTVDPNLTWAITHGVETIDALNGSGSIRSVGGTNYLANTPTLTVGAGNGTGSFSGVIFDSGVAFSFGKSGTGTQTLSGASTYTGATTISAGTLNAGIASVAGVSGAFGKNSAVSIANVANTTLDITGFNTQIGSLTGGGTTGGNVTLGSATLTIGGNNTSPAAYAGIISGNGAISKIGTGTLTLSGQNTFAGGTTISAGLLSLGANSTPTTPGIITSGPLGTGTLTLSGGSMNTAGVFTIANPVFVTPSTTTNIYGNNGGGAYPKLTGAITGSGTLQNSNTSNGLGNAFINGDISGFTGTFNYINNAGNSDNFQFAGTAAGGNFDGSKAHFLLSGATSGNGSLYIAETAGATFQMGDLSGTGGVVNSVTSDTLQIGALNTNTTFSGVIAAGSGIALVKVGTGSLALGGANAYTGTTTISGGTLTVDGSLAAASAVTVGSSTSSQSSALLGGIGTVNGPVTLPSYIGSGSVPHLAPGDAGIGTLTLKSTLAINNGDNLDYMLNIAGQAGTDGASGLVTGVSNLTLGTADVLNVTPGPSFGVGNYDLIDYTGTVAGGANVSGWTVNGLTGDTYSLQTGTDPATGVSALYLNVTSVPEPASIGIIALAGIGLLARRRKSMGNA